MWPSIFAAFAALVVALAPAVACSCGGVDKYGCVVPPADVIAVGRVLSVKTELSSPEGRVSDGASLHRNRNGAWSGDAGIGARLGNRVTVTLAVSEHFRGPQSNPLVVQTDVSSCGFRFQEGLDYLVFATEWQGALNVNMCSATQASKAASARIRQLRALRDGGASPSLFGSVLVQPRRQDQDAEMGVEPAAKLTVVAEAGGREYRTETNDSGVYEFAGLPAGEYFVHVERPAGRIVMWSGGVERVRTPAGIAPGCALNFQVFGDGRLSGNVVAREGQAVSGMVVAELVGSDDSRVARIGGSVEAGRFEITRLWPGRYRLEFLGEGLPGSSPIYYPGTPNKSDAVLIEVGEGSKVEGLSLPLF